MSVNDKPKITQNIAININNQSELDYLNGSIGITSQVSSEGENGTCDELLSGDSTTVNIPFGDTPPDTIGAVFNGIGFHYSYPGQYVGPFKVFNMILYSSQDGAAAFSLKGQIVQEAFFVSTKSSIVTSQPTKFTMPNGFLPQPSAYDNPLVLGDFSFLAFVPGNADPAKWHQTFKDAAVGLSKSTTQSLKDNSDNGRMNNLFETVVLAGWYSVSRDVYGFVKVQVQPSTSSDNQLGTLNMTNDGQKFTADGWVRVHWNVAGQDVYVHFADGGDRSNPILVLGTSTTFPDGDADAYDAAISS